MKQIQIFFIFLSIAISQNLMQLFKNEIPNIRKASDKEINLMLEKLSTLDPSLIAYYLNYLNKRYNEAIGDSRKNGLIEFYTKYDEIAFKKNEWIRGNIKDLEKVKLDHYRSSIAFHFQEMIEDTIARKDHSREIDSYSIEQNFVNYILFKFFSSKADLTYEKTKEYLHENYINKKIIELNQKFSEKTSVKDLKNYLFLIKNGYSYVYPEVNYNYLNIIETYYNIQNPDHFRPEIKFFIPSKSVLHSVETRQIITKNTSANTITEMNRNYELTFESSTNYFIGLNFTSYHKPILKPLSYIESSILFSLSNTFSLKKNEKKVQSIFINRLSGSRNASKETIVNGQNDIKNLELSNQSLIIQFRAPIYIISSSMLFELQAGADINLIKYSYKIISDNDFDEIIIDGNKSLANILFGINFKYILQDNYLLNTSIYYQNKSIVPAISFEYAF
jgi:hypothetical protein